MDEERGYRGRGDTGRLPSQRVLDVAHLLHEALRVQRRQLEPREEQHEEVGRRTWAISTMSSSERISPFCTLSATHLMTASISWSLMSGYRLGGAAAARKRERWVSR